MNSVAGVRRVWVLPMVVVLAVYISAEAQPPTDPLPARQVAVREDSGLVRNDGDVVATIFSTTIRVPDAPWLRLEFDEVLLSGVVQEGTESCLVVTSLADGAYQILNTTHLWQWRYTSAYFNGDAVRLELVAHPRTGSNRIVMSEVIAGVNTGPQRSICEFYDDRVPSDDSRAGRIVPVGCTAWMIDDAGHCFLSAGHCVNDDFQVVEFNVPLSNENGTRNQPPPEDQYAIDSSSIQYTGPGSGNDWCYFGCFPNSTTGLRPDEAQGAWFTLATPPPMEGQTLRITGYGTVSYPISPTWNSVQKTCTGPYVSLSGSWFEYIIDTTGGDSGAPVIFEDTGEAIGIHSVGACYTGGGANGGTTTTNSGLLIALANPQGVCDVDCNGNGVRDEQDIAQNTSSDCNSNDLPDECDLVFEPTSGALSPIGDGSPQSFTIESAPTALGDVTLTFRARADLSSSYEWIDVDINGTPIGSVFVEGADDCPTALDWDQLVVSAATYNTAVAGGDAVVTMTATTNVYTDSCSDPASSISVTVTHNSAVYDCNGNGVLDECETLAPGDFDNDGQVDLDDYASFAECMAGPDATPGPTLPECVGTYLEAFDCDGDTDVDLADFTAFQEVFGGS